MLLYNLSSKKSNFLTIKFFDFTDKEKDVSGESLFSKTPYSLLSIFINLSNA